MFSEAETPTPGFTGLTLATVLSNSDSEHKGTLKVRLLSEGGTKNILENVKMISPYAGAQYGLYLLPEVGDQVLVGFLDGCYDRPFALGSLYTASDPMPGDSFQENNTIKRFQTKAGSVIECSDEKGEESITVKTPQKLVLELREKSQAIRLSASGEDAQVELDGKTGAVHLKGKQQVTIEAGSAKLMMKSDGSITVSGGSVTLKGSGVKVESQGLLTLKGQKSELSGAFTEVNAQGVLTVKGAVTKIN